MERIQKLSFMLSVLFFMYCILQERIGNKKNNRRRWWIREINRSRDDSGYYNTIFRNMKENDPEQFFIHTRMKGPVYEYLLKLLKPRLTKTSIRKAIEPECRLALTLSFLSQGTSTQFLAWAFQMGKSTVRKIIYETCDAIWEILSPTYLQEPNEDSYKAIASDFWQLWNMPNCIGALDGKHINIKCPSASGTQFYNYKHSYSIVLLVSCDAKYMFTQADVGAYGSQSDGGVLKESEFGKALYSGQLNIPPPTTLPNKDKVFPHYFVADAALPLKENMMRPFPGKLLNKVKKVFNYRLSRARRIIENAFGILVARWMCLRTALECSPGNAERIVLAALALHNFIMQNDSSMYCPAAFVDWEDDTQTVHAGDWRKEVESNDVFRPIHLRPSNTSVSAFKLREELAEYFMQEGSVPFQEKN